MKDSVTYITQLEVEERRAWTAFFGMAISKIAVFPNMDAIEAAGRFADQAMPYYRARFNMQTIGDEKIPPEIQAELDREEE
jgi:hypothetical protein